MATSLVTPSHRETKCPYLRFREAGRIWQIRPRAEFSRFQAFIFSQPWAELNQKERPPPEFVPVAPTGDNLHEGNAGCLDVLLHTFNIPGGISAIQERICGLRRICLMSINGNSSNNNNAQDGSANTVRFPVLTGAVEETQKALPFIPGHGANVPQPGNGEQHDTGCTPAQRLAPPPASGSAGQHLVRGEGHTVPTGNDEQGAAGGATGQNPAQPQPELEPYLLGSGMHGAAWGATAAEDQEVNIGEMPIRKCKICNKIIQCEIDEICLGCKGQICQTPDCQKHGDCRGPNKGTGEEG